MHNFVDERGIHTPICLAYQFKLVDELSVDFEINKELLALRVVEILLSLD